MLRTSFDNVIDNVICCKTKYYVTIYFKSFEKIVVNVQVLR